MRRQIDCLKHRQWIVNKPAKEPLETGETLFLPTRQESQLMQAARPLRHDPLQRRIVYVQHDQLFKLQMDIADLRAVMIIRLQ